MAAGVLSKLLYGRLLKRIPSAAVRLGKAWGKTTDRFTVLRWLNTFFYLTGMAVILAGATLGLINLVKPAPIPLPVIYFQADDTLDARQLLDLVNKERKARNLKELNEDTRLSAIAQQRLEDMIQNQYYSHMSPSGSYFYDLFPSQLIKADYSCENLDVQFTVDEGKYVNDWLHSSKGHKECMLNSDATSAGYAVGLFNQDKNSRIYLVVGIHSSSISKIEAPKPAKPLQR